jgi:hypothetical protein
LAAPARPTVDTLIRRQLVMALVAAAVVLLAVVMVAWATPDADSSHAVLRVAPDGSRVVTASPAAESSRWALWVTIAALVAVAAVLVALLHHTVRVVRSTFQRGGAR